VQRLIEDKEDALSHGPLLGAVLRARVLVGLTTCILGLI
jgi:hypothetical protein